MKVFFKIVLISASILLFEKNAISQVTEHSSFDNIIVQVTSYNDFKPFSYAYKKKNHVYNYCVFEEPLNKILKLNNIKTKFYSNKSYNENIQDLKEGKSDILLGMYNETQSKVKIFSHIEYLYPAILQNPVHLITIPGNKKITQINDLKKLKGHYISKEFFSDYVLEKFNDYGITPIDDILQAYEKLFLGEIDYIVGSYYYQYVQALQYGLKNYISFSKKPLWTMPMFIGISKKSDNYNRLKILLSKKINEKSFLEDIENELKNHIQAIETNTIGIVPPTFVLKTETNVLTPADETINKD